MNVADVIAGGVIGAVLMALGSFLFDRWMERRTPQRKVRQRDYYRFCKGCKDGTEIGRSKMIREVDCRSCKRPMVFVKVEGKDGKNDRVMPLDAKPSEKGRWYIDENEGDGSREDPHFAYYTRSDDAAFKERAKAGALRTPHHATCPDAESFRKKKPDRVSV